MLWCGPGASKVQTACLEGLEQRHAAVLILRALLLLLLLQEPEGLLLRNLERNAEQSESSSGKHW